jgi:HTH-type transcriptional repressor of NAD biosynthesis genes
MGEDAVTETILAEADARPADFYIITNPVGVPFEDDGFRRFQNHRAWQHQWFYNRLPSRASIVSGTQEERLKHAIYNIDVILDTGFQYALPLEYQDTAV